MPQLRLAADEGPNTNARAAVAISRLLSLHFDGLDTSTLLRRARWLLWIL